MTDTEWHWIGEQVALAIHEAQLAEHGGLSGLRDRNAFLSALARPKNLVACGIPDVADLAAAYSYDIARNHAFNDGNKRTAFVVARLFLLDHGFTITASKPARVLRMLAVASGEMSQESLAGWFRAHLAASGLAPAVRPPA